MPVSGMNLSVSSVRELAEGKELNAACQDWNVRIDPKNYMKATAPITRQMIDNAKAFLAENGYEESFNRRCATMDDIRTVTFSMPMLVMEKLSPFPSSTV